MRVGLCLCSWVCTCVFVFLCVVILRYIVSPTFSLVKSFKYLLQDKNYYAIYALRVHYNSRYLAFLLSCMDCCVCVLMLFMLRFNQCSFAAAVVFLVLVVFNYFLRSLLELKRCHWFYSACVSVV